MKMYRSIFLVVLFGSRSRVQGSEGQGSKVQGLQHIDIIYSGGVRVTMSLPWAETRRQSADISRNKKEK